MNEEQKRKLTEFLLSINEGDFVKVKKIMIEGKVKFFKTPLTEFSFLNLTLIEGLNDYQLIFIFKMIENMLSEKGYDINEL